MARVKMAEWVPYRSREVVWAKERIGPNGERQVRKRDGQVEGEEGFLRRYEKLEEEKP